MSGDKKIKVRYIGNDCADFKNGEIVEASFLKDDPSEKWYVIETKDGEGEFAFPRHRFEVIEDGEG